MISRSESYATAFGGVVLHTQHHHSNLPCSGASAVIYDVFVGGKITCAALVFSDRVVFHSSVDRRLCMYSTILNINRFCFW